MASTQPLLPPEYTRLAPPRQGIQYTDISADGQARQHNGNVYNTNTNNYTIRQRRSDDTMRESDLNKRFSKAAAEGQTQ
jgi:hypothetical protein